jgi:hypothetical protein
VIFSTCPVPNISRLASPAGPVPLYIHQKSSKFSARPESLDRVWQWQGLNKLFARPKMIADGYCFFTVMVATTREVSSNVEVDHTHNRARSMYTDRFKSIHFPVPLQDSSPIAMAAPLPIRSKRTNCSVQLKPPAVGECMLTPSAFLRPNYTADVPRTLDVYA